MRGGEVAGYGHGDPEECGAEDRQAGVFPCEPAEPVVAPGGDAEGEEEDVAGEVSELEAPDIDADGDELADEKRSGTDGDCAEEPPEVGWDWRGCALGLRKRRAGEFTPEAVDEGEDQESLREPEWAVDELLVIPEPDECGPEAVACKCFDDGGGERAEKEAEG